ncbi:M14 family metallopeptidase [Paenibacillus cremeus]|uniref:LysM peptidoglycan-binding domain-containing protein n=1 Tax=Paenibacillus cremeus TaxID=2163881 RepID=A0A559K3G7_9BACL|nr:M14 family metallopeptidase [Paenibacillus cremeus]TVY06682.1 LysM peptidoglycan-binding domain-containing protein [Paenibacillus cremeus]
MSSRRHLVQAGETLAVIAGRYNLALAELTAANPGIDPRRLRIGQAVMIPDRPAEAVVKTTGKYGYAEMVRDLDALKAAYPFLIMDSIGHSAAGRTIPVVRLGTGDKEVHYNGAFHANEWITGLLLMKFIEDYASAYHRGQPLANRDVRELFEQTSLYVVPMVNPDGVELVHHGLEPGDPHYEQVYRLNQGSSDFSQWKANIRGIDLNDQFPAHWEEERNRRSVAGPGPRDFGGAAPLTEPEAIAIEAFTRSRDFQLVMAFHTQAQEIYWNYRDLEPAGAEAVVQRLAQVSGYVPVKLTGSDAGYKDWFIQEYRRLGFTIEAGIGVNPLPIEQFDTIYADLIGLMLEGLAIGSGKDSAY